MLIFKHHDDNNNNTITGDSSRGLTIASLIFLVLMTTLILYRVCQTRPRFSDLFMAGNLGLMFLVYILSFASLFQFTINWPYRKFCAYGGDKVGCQWYIGLNVVIVGMTVNIVVIMILISMLSPVCLLFCPCLRPNESNMPIYSRDAARSVSSNVSDSDNDNDDDDIKNDAEDDSGMPIPTSAKRGEIQQAINPDRRKKVGCFISLPEWLSIISLGTIFAFLNIIFCVLLLDQWEDATSGAQTYTDNSWETAECIDKVCINIPFHSVLCFDLLFCQKMY